MLAEPSKSLATLSGAVQPIRLHFPAYRGISVIQSVSLKIMTILLACIAFVVYVTRCPISHAC